MSPSIAERLNHMRRLLGEGKNSTQEELRDSLEKAGFDVNQSTISRDLRKIGAIKAIDPKGRTIYKFSETVADKHLVAQSVWDLIKSIDHNGALIVISTTPGSASLVARHLDIVKPAGILGTIAGDDTIFVAPIKSKDIKQTIRTIRDSLLNKNMS